MHKKPGRVDVKKTKTELVMGDLSVWKNNWVEDLPFDTLSCSKIKVQNILEYAINGQEMFDYQRIHMKNNFSQCLRDTPARWWLVFQN